ncbi:MULTISPECIES: pyruvate kinase [Deefgea]|uniref:Pyruvate kinase n=1 Tax=Deefgea chitinilytica TaxID=570276 RepID=A0ABS2CB52_9NEIS|nr:MULTISPECIES: pyruvate kinase [Deefgea]MBM5571252.1 pyruvate kinase [Deefgea chitinilytica]MBM9888484.1 pyruvate kinase [Deefgea sp. CFH1-16]
MQCGTKIVATLGPASNDPAVLESLIAAGVNTVRLNFSHGTAQDHTDRAALVRSIAAKLGKSVAVLADLQGPKIRVGKFEKNKIELKKGAKFILDAECELGNQDTVGLDYKELPNDVEPGVELLLDDGKIQLIVDSVVGAKVFTTVTMGGVLSNNKGINRKGGGLTAPALTAKDMEDIKTAAALQADYIAVSFPKSAADMYMARTLLRAAGGHGGLIAKIERTEAIANLEEILAASEGIMVARGDLAVEVGDATVPALQKRMIKMARKMHKLTITATQMMESMIESPVPTRAEVSDCANAVLDGTDAVMLSAESAAGKYPLEAVQAMARTCLEAERSGESKVEAEFDKVTDFTKIDEAVAMSALYAASKLPIKAIVCISHSGASALWLSRYNTGVPIYVFTQELNTYRKLALFRHVRPILIDAKIGADREEQLAYAQLELLRAGVVVPGDKLVVTLGVHKAAVGSGANTMRIVQVGTASR